MKHLRRFLRLPAAERQLLIKAALLLVAVKLGTRLLPFRALRRVLARVAGASVGPRRAGHTSAERVTWTVEAASRYIPGVKGCLSQALTAQALLTRHGHPALVHIGVARGERGRFRVHAWVESEGKPLTGGSELQHFTRLAVLDPLATPQD